MLTDGQIRIRATGLTATDMVVLAGASDYSSPLDVYASKVESAAPRPSNLRMSAGNALEPLILAELARRHGLVMRPGETVRHPDLPWVLATPDAFVLEHETDDKPSAVAEVKLVGPRMVRAWRDADGGLSFPESVCVQTAWQMLATGTTRAYVGALLGDFGDDSFHSIVIEAIAELQAALLEMGERFWTENVLARVPPPAGGGDADRRALEHLFPRAIRLEMPEASDDAADLGSRYVEIVGQIGTLEKEKESIANTLRATIGDRRGVVSARGKWKATWESRQGQIDPLAVAAAHGIPVTELHRFRRPAPRVLRVAAVKEKDR